MTAVKTTLNKNIFFSLQADLFVKEAKPPFCPSVFPKTKLIIRQEKSRDHVSDRGDAGISSFD
jgi:hypothetical protein